MIGWSSIKPLNIFNKQGTSFSLTIISNQGDYWNEDYNFIIHLEKLFIWFTLSRNEISLPIWDLMLTGCWISSAIVVTAVAIIGSGETFGIDSWCEKKRSFCEGGRVRGGFIQMPLCVLGSLVLIVMATIHRTSGRELVNIGQNS